MGVLMIATGATAVSGASALSEMRGTEFAAAGLSELSTQLGQEEATEAPAFCPAPRTISPWSAQRAPTEYSMETTPFFSTHRTDMPVPADAAVLIDQIRSERNAAIFFSIERRW
jgi:hypothetical protein